MCKILVADDEYLEREVIKQIVHSIEDASIVGEGNSGRIAIELCAALRPDLLFINRNMGGVGGFDAIKQIRKSDRNMVIVLTTADNVCLSQNDLGALNINEYLLKPIRPSKIREIVRKYLVHGRLAAPPIAPPEAAVPPPYPVHALSKEIANALQYIDGHYQDNLSLEAVAGTVYLSTYYFSRLFKREVGVNFSSYILQKKLAEAKKLLDETERSVLDIATTLNFREQGYFCKVFKKNVGITPTGYRSMAATEKMKRRRIAVSYV